MMMKKQIIGELIIERGLQGLLIAYPILLLTIKGGMSASFLIFLMLSSALIFNAKSRDDVSYIDFDGLLFSISMSATIISLSMSQLRWHTIDMPAFDSPTRLLLSIPIFLALREVNYQIIGKLQFGLVFGAITIGVAVLLSGQGIFATSYYLIHIHLGDLALMLGLLSLFSINWDRNDSTALLVLKVCGLFAGFYVSLLTGARGGWIAIPIIVIAWIFISSADTKTALSRLAISMSIMLLGVALGYHFLEVVELRIDAAMYDLTSANSDTSLGIRFQLWGAAFNLFMQNPIFGVGSEGFILAMDGLASSGMITQVAAEIGKGEVHSYYFATLAKFGAVGIISLLLLFFGPLWLFIKAHKSPYQFHKVAARMGTTLVLGYAVFCLSVEMFNLKMVATFYGVTVAVLLAAATNRTVGISTKQKLGLD